MNDLRLKDLELKRHGLLWWERRHLREYDIDSPGMRVMLSDRMEVKRRSIEDGDGYWDYYRLIAQIYVTHDWFFTNGRKNPFAMLDWYKKRRGIQDTPERKRRVRAPKDFAAVAAAGMSR